MIAAVTQTENYTLVGIGRTRDGAGAALRQAYRKHAAQFNVPGNTDPLPRWEKHVDEYGVQWVDLGVEGNGLVVSR